MKNYKQFFAGVIVGGMLLTTGNVLADNNTLPTITNWVKYVFNGKEKLMPSGYTTLNYEGRTYVPARFIAEELGADVKWDANSNTVIVEKKEATTPSELSSTNKCVTEGTSTETITQRPAVTYDELPVTKTINGVRVEIYSIDQSDDEYTMLYFRVKNTLNAPVQFIQASGYLEANGKQYRHDKLNTNNLSWKDTTWYTDMKEDDDNEGYIMISKVPNEIHQGTVHVDVLQNDRTQKTSSFDFDIKW